MSASRLSGTAVPPFLLGAGLAVVGEVSVGLLLYGGPGFIPALSVILAVLFLALAAGVWSGRRGGEEDRVEEARRRWLMALVAVSVAALFSAGWEVFQGFGATALTQAVGLAVLAALPLYAGGAVLGHLVSASGSGTSDPGASASSSGPAALAGAGVGVLAAGHLLFPALSPTAILLLCLMIVSAAALLHGRVLDRGVSITPLGAREEDGRRVTVERWVRGRPPLLRTAILEGDRVRVLVGEEGKAVYPDESMVEEALPLWRPEFRKVMVLGGGGGGLAWRLAAGNREREVRLVDGNGGLLAAVREDLPFPGNGTLRSRTLAVPDFLLEGAEHLPEEEADVVVLEWNERRASVALDRVPASVLERLRRALGPPGVLVLFPMGIDPVSGEEGLLSLAEDVGRFFSRTALYVARNDPEHGQDVPSSRRSAWRRARAGTDLRQAVLVAGPEGGPAWPERLRGFLQVPVTGGGEGTVSEAEGMPAAGGLPGAPGSSL